MEERWLARPATIRLLWRAFVGVLLLTVVAGPFVGDGAHEGPGATFGFGAWFGFAACTALIGLAKLLGLLLKRPDTYYDPERDDG